VRAPHPATVQRSSAVHPAQARGRHLQIAQRSSNTVSLEDLAKNVTRYPPVSMAGNCANSTHEVAELLGRACVGYAVAVYRDRTGEVRNHIAAVGRTGDGERVIDATWKQFPYLLDPTTKLTSLPFLGSFSFEEWETMISEYTPGIADLVVNREASEEAALEWMRRERRRLLARRVPARRQRTCTLF
jgi:hypothetical protein